MPTTITNVSAPTNVLTNDHIEGSVSIDNSQHAFNEVQHDGFPYSGGPTTITNVSVPTNVLTNDHIEGSVSIDNSQHAFNDVHSDPLYFLHA
jgi:hypothetical protein